MAGFYEPRAPIVYPVYTGFAAGAPRGAPTKAPDGAFFTSRGLLEAMSLFCICHRAAASESRTATCNRRGRRPQNSMNDERPTINGFSPGRQAPYLTKKSQKIFVSLNTYFYN